MIPHNRPTLGQLETEATTRVISSGWVAQGKEVEAFEDELCQFLDLPSGHAVALSSGSAALYLALWALDARGKRVGIPVYSCASLRNAVGMAQAEPAYLDCHPHSVNVDADATGLTPDDILILPSIFGIPARMPSALQAPKVVEDIAQAIGARSGHTRIGARGAVGVCSFYATKLLTSGGQGGVVFSRDKALVDAVRDYREFDCRDDQTLRFNFQMTDLQAAVGRVQLSRLPEFLTRRDYLYNIYQSCGLTMLDSAESGHSAARLRAVVRSDTPEKLIRSLEMADIRAIVPISRSELLDTPERYPHARELATTTVSLPCFPSLTDDEAWRIASIVREHQA